MLARRRVALIIALLMAACAQPDVLRDGVRVPYEQAAASDLGEARVHIEAKRYAQARTILERFLDELAASRIADEALFLLGEVYVRLDKQERAVLAWRRLIEAYPRSRYAAEASFRAAEVYRELGRPEIGRRVLAEASFSRADDALRVRMYRLLADLSRMESDYVEAVVALAYARRDSGDAEQIREIDLEIEELIRDRLRERDLESLGSRVPRGPVFDAVHLAIGRRAIARSDYERALAALERMPRRLRPADQLEHDRLMTQARAGARTVMHSIGLAVPLSGPYAPFGEAVLRGVSLALGLFDDPPGPYRVHIRDTAGDAARGEHAVKELAGHGVRAIIGPMRSVVVEGSVARAESDRVPMLTLAPREDLAFMGEYVFRMGLTASDQVRVLADYAVARKGFRRFAILYPQDEYGRSFKDLFWDEIEARGGSVVGVEGYSPDAVDWQAEIKKLVGLFYLTDEERELLDEREGLLRRPAANEERLSELAQENLPPYVDFDALFIPDVAPKVGLILPQLRFYDVRDVVFLGPSDWNDEKLIEIAGRDARGTVFADAFHPQSKDPVVAGFVTRYRESYGQEPELFAALGHDAAAILRTLIDRSGQVSRDDLRAELLGVRDFPGVTGLTSFDDVGSSRKDLHLLTVRNNEIDELDAKP